MPNVKLIEGSIAKWDLIAHGLATDGGASNCPLCIVYFDDDCADCPVYGKSGATYCFSTPYRPFCYILRNTGMKPYNITLDMLYGEERNNACDLCEEEIEFLVSLLPEDHRYREET